MRIKTRLRLNTAIILALMLLMFSFLLWSLREASQANQKATLVAEMQISALERTMLMDDYLLHEEERARAQWVSETEELRGLVQLAAERFLNTPHEALLEDIQQGFERTVSLSSRLVESREEAKKAGTGNMPYSEGEKRLIGQLLLKAYVLIDQLDKLREATQRTSTAARRHLALLAILFSGVVLTAVVGNSAAINHILTKRIARLREGTAIIGSGRLDYRFPIEGNDELSDLAKANNEMAGKLQNSHTSINHLQQQIRERQRAEEALRDLFARQEALLAAVPDIIMEVDTDKVYTWANRAGSKFFGEDVIGKEAAHYFVGEQATYGLVQPLFNGDENVLYVESWQRRKDAQERLLAWWCRVLKDDNGNVTGVLSSARDITEQRQLEREKAEMEVQLRQAQKLEAIGTLASGVAHEINNPINGVMNYAQLILDRSAPEKATAEYAREIITETERVSVIVRNLLQFARQEKQTHSPARIEDIVESVLSLMRTVLHHDRIEVKTDIPEDLPLIKCRSQQIQQVIMNLLTNARDALNDKYRGPHGDKEIEICCRVLEKSGRSWVRVTVGDHGGGIADAIRDRIFDPFFTTKPREQGTGLGLAISHGLVKEHHGILHFETEPGRGTQFHLDLPVNNGWTLE